MSDRGGELELLAVEAFGVRIAFAASDAALLARVRQLIPPHAVPCPVDDSQPRFSLLAEPGVGYRAVLAEAGEETFAGLELAVTLLDTAVRAHVASFAHDRVFIRAGVVVAGGRAIVLPGPAFSGKTTLVRALVQAGLEYYSDEFAVLDGDGRVHPYRVPLEPDGFSISDGAGVHPDAALPVAVMAVVPYRPGAVWRTDPRTAGEGMLALMQNGITVGLRPAEAMQASRRAASGARVLIGERGEAAQAADALIALSEELAV